MRKKRLKIAQVNTSDIGGGAAKIAWEMCQAYENWGHFVNFFVGFKKSKKFNVIELRNDKYSSTVKRFFVYCSNKLKENPYLHKKISVLLYYLGQPIRFLKFFLGIEDFDYPATHRFLLKECREVDILHCHNLHGGYFDLRCLPQLSKLVPTVLTLHDAWMLSGHCAHSFDCQRWKIGCGKCPDLAIPPAIRRDATKRNWRQKTRIYAKSSVYVVTPSAWLMQKVQESNLSSAIAMSKVIPNGVDLNIFQPFDKIHARSEVGLPADALIILFSAHGIKTNTWKDYGLLMEVVKKIGYSFQGKALYFIALGDISNAQNTDARGIKHIPYQMDSQIVAKYYQSADIYIHPARADTFPTTVLEALACALPVIATDVGGIPEQVNSLEPWGRFGRDAATGCVVQKGDVDQMVGALMALLQDGDLRSQLGENARSDAEKRFDQKTQLKVYLDFYFLALEHHKKKRIGLSA